MVISYEHVTFTYCESKRDDEEAHVTVTRVAGHVKVPARRHDSDLNLEIQALAFNNSCDFDDSLGP
jgi:hypothetical protein